MERGQAAGDDNLKIVSQSLPEGGEVSCKLRRRHDHRLFHGHCQCRPSGVRDEQRKIERARRRVSAVHGRAVGIQRQAGRERSGLQRPFVRRRATSRGRKVKRLADDSLFERRSIDNQRQ